MESPVVPPTSAYYIALALGFGCGLLDLFVGPVQVVSALVVIGTFTLALAYPTRAWAWALLVGILVPTAHMAANQLGYTNPARPSNLYITYLALIPAFTGAYSAILLQWMARRSKR